MAAWNSQQDFLTEVKKVSEITSVISPAELDGLCSLEQHFRHVEQKFKNVGL